MQGDPSSQTTGPAPALCVGEAALDLVCERSLLAGEAPNGYVPHCGGTVANVALMCARAGAPAALAGAVGDDPWGRRLRATLARAGVHLDHFSCLASIDTPLVLTTLDGAGEPTYKLYGGDDELVAKALLGATGGEPRADTAAIAGRLIVGAGALFISTNSMVGPRSRALTLALREQALAAGRPVIFDPNLRLHRWADPAAAVTLAISCLAGATLVHCNASEARLLSGSYDLRAAAVALLDAGVRNVVITDGAGGTLLRGAIDCDYPPLAPAWVRSTVGAGDALSATLLAALTRTGGYEAAIAAAIPDALQAAAVACDRWGACD